MGRVNSKLITGGSATILHAMSNSREEVPRLDLHVHSQFSPCANDVSVERDAEVAVARGLQLIAVTDHGTVPVPIWFKDYIRELERVQEKAGEKLTLLKGMEVDIVEGGRLAVSTSVLKQLDIIVASLHSIPSGSDVDGYWRKSFIGAVESGFVTVLGHLTDVGWRKVAPPLEYALEVLDVARAHNVAVELNYHHRDPQLWFLRLAVERGVLLVPTSDAHSLSEIGNLWWHKKSVKAIGHDSARVKWLTQDRLTRV